jgi:vacuolar-type H+-ATPase catalytic subunit A/Vma1
MCRHPALPGERRCLDGGTATVPGPFGLSMREIVGEVLASNAELALGSRVVG